MGRWKDLFLCIRKMGKSDSESKEKYFVENGALLLEHLISTCQGKTNPIRIFSAQELSSATGNYHESQFVGSGVSLVYRGVFEGRNIAIKKFVVRSPLVIEMFLNEVVSLAQINHKNIVRLLGCCLETSAPSIVFEYVPNGTLHDYIQTTDSTCMVKWDGRLKIATEVAHALAYLHTSRQWPIIHMKINSSSILLDEFFSAKVSTFGFSVLIPEGKEWPSKPDKGKDVYDFGVVLFEILIGRVPWETMEISNDVYSGKVGDRFISYMKTHLQPFVDNNFFAEEKTEQLLECAKIAMMCIHESREERPTMQEVAQELSRIKRFV